MSPDLPRSPSSPTNLQTMGSQSSKHALVLDDIASNDPRRIRDAFHDDTLSPIFLLKSISRDDLNTIFPDSPSLVEKRLFWNGLSPLHFAAQQRDTQVLKKIVNLLNKSTDSRLQSSDAIFSEKGNIWSVRDSQGLTPLSRAVQAENIPAIRILAQAGANLDEPFSSHDARKSDASSWTHVRHAAAKGLRHVLAALLDEGANYCRWGPDGRRPVHIAVQAGQLETVKELVERDLAANNQPPGAHTKRTRSISKYIVRGSAVRSLEIGSSEETLRREGGLPSRGDAEASSGLQIISAVQSALRDAVREYSAAPRRDTTQPNTVSNRERGGNLLHLACTHSRPHILSYLLSLNEFATSWEEMNDSGKTPIFMAIRHGSLECVKLLIEKGANAAKKDIEQWTVLHEAVKAGDNHVNLVQYLIQECHSDVNAADDDGWTPLHVAARFSSTKAVDILVQAGSDIDATTEDNQTALQLASARATSSEVLRRLLVHGAALCMTREGPLNAGSLSLDRKDFVQLCIILDHLLQFEESHRKKLFDFETRSEAGDTVLHVCVKENHLESISRLLALGAEVDAKNHDSVTPLHLACKNGASQVVKLLLSGGANPNMPRADGMMPIHIACDAGFTDVVAALIDAKCDVNATVEHAARYRGFTPLMFACRLGSPEIAAMLIRANADMNIAKVDGFTALHLAALNGNSVTCGFLIKAGADYLVSDESGYPALHIATRHGQIDAVSEMLVSNVDPNCSGSQGITALHVAVFIGDARLTWLLIRGGADVNAVSDEKATALHVAAGRDHGRVSMQLLIANGAHVDMRDTKGNTPLHDACYRGLSQNVRLLLRRGAAPSTVNTKGATPLHLTAALGNVESVAALLSYGADMQALDKDGLTPYGLAAKQGRRETMVTLFREMHVSLAEIAPTQKFEQWANGSADDVLCVICQHALINGDMMRTLPCQHRYHDRCILSWLGGEEMFQHDSCPLCQEPVLRPGCGSK